MPEPFQAALQMVGKQGMRQQEVTGLVAPVFLGGSQRVMPFDDGVFVRRSEVCRLLNRLHDRRDNRRVVPWVDLRRLWYRGWFDVPFRN